MKAVQTINNNQKDREWVGDCSRGTRSPGLLQIEGYLLSMKKSYHSTSHTTCTNCSNVCIHGQVY